jgi:anti-sigma factor RsiW
MVGDVLWQMLDHRFTRARASEYLDGDLSPEGRRRVERHTSVCPQCRAFIASLRQMLEALPGVAASPRPGLADGVVERLRHEG